MTSANLPVNQPAERAVLAACMARKECVYEAMEAVARGEVSEPSAEPEDATQRR